MEQCMRNSPGQPGEITPRMLDLFRSGEVVDRWACDLDPGIMSSGTNASQEVLIRDEHGVVHAFICDQDDKPVLYNGVCRDGEY